MTHFRHNMETLAILLALIAYALYSFNDAIRKELVVEGYDIFQILFWGNLVAVVVFLIISPKLGGLKETFRTKKWKWHFLRSCIIVVTFASATYAFGYLPMVDAYTIIFVAPFVTILFSWLLFKEQPSPMVMLTTVLGFVGVLVALNPAFTDFILAHFAAIVVALASSANKIITKKLGETETKLSLSLFPCLMVVAISWIMMDGMLPQLPQDVSDYPWFALSGLYQGAGVLLMAIALTLAPLSWVASMHYTQLVWGAVLGFFVFAEIPQLNMVVGCVLVAVAGLWQLVLSRKVKAEPKGDVKSKVS